MTNKFTPKNIQSPDRESIFSKRTTFSNSRTTDDILNNRVSFYSELDRVNQQFCYTGDKDSDPTILNRATTYVPRNKSPNQGSVDPSQNSTDISVLSSAEAITRSLALNDFETNILDNYDNITYNFKLIIAPHTVLNQPIIGDIPYAVLSSSYTIAETGITTKYNIKDVEIESVAAANDRTKNTQATNFTIRIVEPQGITFFDNLFDAASRLGINNIFDAPIILVLTFKGYTQTGLPTEVNVANRAWRLQLKDVRTEMDMGGSSYIIDACQLGDYGYHKQSSAAIIKQPISITAGTVGKFFDELEFNLNAQEVLAAEAGKQARNEYKFHLTQEMRDWTIGKSPLEVDAPSMWIDNNGQRVASIKPQTMLQDIVDNVMAVTKEAVELVNPSAHKDKLTEAQKGDFIAKIFYIHCDIEYIGFNPNNNEYIRRYNYYIDIYEAPAALTDNPTDEGQEQRIAKLLESSLAKKYDYMFTGNNTDIINLDINLDSLWRLSTSYYTKALHKAKNAANFVTPDSTRTGGETQDDLSVKQENSFQSIEAEYGKDFAADLQRQFEETAANDRKAIAENIVEGKVSNAPETLQNITQSQDASRGIIPLEGQQEILADRGIDKFTSDLLPVESRLPLATPRRTLIENLPSVSVDNLINKHIIRTIDPSLDLTRTGYMQEETTDYGRTIFGIITNQLYTDTGDNLLTIEMEIRGDPYWIGETGDEVTDRMKLRTQIDQLSDDITTTQADSNKLSKKIWANFTKGQQSFLLKFRTPTEFNENTGLAQLGDSTTFLGLYVVKKVNHVFTEGRFVQRIEAYRDLNTNAEVIKRLMT